MLSKWLRRQVVGAQRLAHLEGRLRQWMEDKLRELEAAQEERQRKEEEQRRHRQHYLHLQQVFGVTAPTLADRATLSYLCALAPPKRAGTLNY